MVYERHRVPPRWAVWTAAALLGIVAQGCARSRPAKPVPEPALSADAMARAVDAAREAAERGDWASVETLVTPVIQADARHAEALRLRGQARFERDDVPGAADDLEAAAEAGSEGLDFHLLAAQALDAAGRYEKAVQAAESAVLDAPDDPRGHQALGLLQLKLERYKAAYEQLRVAVDLGGGGPQTALAAAEAALGARMFDEAMAMANAALEQSAQEEGGDAVEQARPLLVIMRRYLMRGAAGDAEAAQQYLEQFRSRAGGSPTADAAIGEALVRANRPAEAARYLEKLPAGAPAWAHRARAEALLALGQRFDVALEEAKAAAEAADAADGDLAALGWAQWKCGETDAALETLRTAVERVAAPSVRGRCHYQLSRVLESQGRSDEAKEHLALARDLGYPLAR